MNQDDVIKSIMDFATYCDTIDVDSMCDKIKMAQQNKKILDCHTHKIWLGKNGDWYTYLPDPHKAKKRKLVRRHSKEAIEKTIINYWQSAADHSPSLMCVFTEWNNKRTSLEKISPATSGRISQDANRYFKDIADRAIDSFSVNELVDLIEATVSHLHLTPKAFTNYKSLLRGTFHFARRKKYTDVDIDNVISMLEVYPRMLKHNIKDDAKEVFNDTEMKALIEYLYANQDSCNIALLTMLLTGIRPGEAVALKHSDIIPGYGIKIRRTETRYKDNDGRYVYKIKDFPKTFKGIRTIPIPKDYVWLIDVLVNANANDDFIFVVKNERINTQKLRLRLYQICKKIGIVRKSPNKERKTYGTILLDNGCDRNLIENLMGHVSIMTTEEHYHRNRKSEQKISATISALPEFRIDGDA